MTHDRPPEIAPPEVKAAIRTLRTYLDREFLAEGCRNARMFGRISCSAVEPAGMLEGLDNDLITGSEDDTR